MLVALKKKYFQDKGKFGHVMRVRNISSAIEGKTSANIKIIEICIYWFRYTSSVEFNFKDGSGSYLQLGVLLLEVVVEKQMSDN